MVRRRPSGNAPLRSRTNPLVRSLRLLGERPEVRDEEGSFLIDGVRLVEEAIRRGAVVEQALTSPRLDRGERGRALHRQLDDVAERRLDATDAVLGAILGLPHHQGVVARVRRRVTELEAILAPEPPGLLLVASGVQEPGNLGGMLRVAAAAGAGAMLVLQGSVDPWHPKAARASAGAVFHLPVVRHLPGVTTLQRLGAAGYRRVGAVARGGTRHTELDWRLPVALIVGGEAAGLPDVLGAELDARASVPMAAGVESLNVLAATALLLYEATRVDPCRVPSRTDEPPRDGPRGALQ